MQIIKDKRIIDDVWQTIDDDASVPIGNVCVSLARLKRDKRQLLHRNGQLGVRLQATDSIAELADHIKHLTLIELDFPDFADGRLFSQAWILRERLGYTEELRAIGNYMPDQAFYLSRVGINAFRPEKFGDLPIILAKLNAFTVNYQKSIN